MDRPNNAMIAEVLDSLQNGLIDFLKPKLSLPDPDWKDVVEPAINPAFLPVFKKKIKDGASPSLEILDLASLIKIITWNWRTYYDELGFDAKNYFFEALNIRNKIAHQEAEDIPDEDALRDLDTLRRIAEVCGHKQTQEIASKYHKAIFLEVSKTIKGEDKKTKKESTGGTAEPVELKVEKLMLDELDEKLSQAFVGRAPGWS